MSSTPIHRLLIILCPVLLLIADTWRLVAPSSLFPSLIMSAGLFSFIAGLPALSHVLGHVSSLARRLALTVVFIGAAFGASMQVMFRSALVLREAGFDEAATHVLSQQTMQMMTRFPGILYPLGLLLLAILLKLAGQGWTAVSAVALGAVLFPIGRIAQLQPANFASAVLLLCAWWLILRPWKSS